MMETQRTENMDEGPDNMVGASKTIYAPKTEMEEVFRTALKTVEAPNMMEEHKSEVMMEASRTEQPSKR